MMGFNNDFELRQREESRVRKKKEISDFLETQGFQAFTSDGKYFLDKEQKKYADHGLVFPFTKLENGSEIVYHTILHCIEPETDLFNINYIPGESFLKIPSSIDFVGKRKPSPQEYNGFVLFDELSWHVSAMDGSFTRCVYPVLMLKYDIKKEA